MKSVEKINNNQFEGQVEYDAEVDGNDAKKLGGVALQGVQAEQQNDEGLLEAESKEASSVPEGWYTIYGLAGAIGLKDLTIKRLLDKHPEVQFRDYKAANGLLRPHYNLAEIRNLEEVQLLTEPVPEGWYTFRSLSKKIGVSQISVRKILNDHPEVQTRTYKASGGLSPYYNLEEINNLPEIKRLLTESAPDGWYTSAGLAEKMGTTGTTIGKILNDHPEIQSRDYNTRAGVFPHYELAEVQDLPEIKELLNAEPAPDGWYTINGLAVELGLKNRKIKEILNNHPEIQPKEYKVGIGLHPHYNLEEIQNLSETKVLLNAKTAPEGWYTIKGLEEEIGISSGTIKKILQNHLEIKTEEYKTKNGLFPHYDLEEVQNLPEIKEMLRVELAPEGWYTFSSLLKELGSDYETVKKILNNHPEIQPREYRARVGRVFLHYNLAEIQNLPEINIESAPEGWYVIKDLAKEVGLNSKTVKKILDNHPEIHSKEYKISNGRLYTHYNLEEVRNLPETNEFLNLPEINEFLNAESAPEGWYTIAGLSRKIGLSGEVIKKIVDDHMKEIQLKRCSTRAGVSSHYRLEEVKNLPEIKALLDAESAPEGWYTSTFLAVELNIGKGTIRRILSNHPEIQSNEYKIGSFLSPHYNLEEVRNLPEVRELLTELAPEGWYTLNGLTVKTGLSYESIKRMLDSHPEVQPRNYKTSSGSFPHYNLEEIQSLPETKELLSIESAPEGWYTLNGLVVEMSMGSDTIKKILNNHPEIQPREFKTSNGLFPHYNLEEVKNLPEIKALLYAESAPEGWYTISGLMAKTGLSYEPIKRALDNHSEVQSRDYKAGNGLSPHYFLEEVQNLPEIMELSIETAPEGWYTVKGLAEKIGTTVVTVKKILNNHSEIRSKDFRLSNRVSPHYNLEEIKDILLEDLEDANAGTSIAEKTLAFYIVQAVGQDRVSQNQRPEWLRHPDTNRKREIDILIGPPPEPGIGIEYDGELWHKDVERDMDKNRLAKERKGIEIIHVREKGCPELTDGSVCIYRKDSSEKSLEESIKACLLVIQEKYPALNIQMPDIDILRDGAKIYESIRDKMSANIDSVDEGSFNQLSVVSA